MHSVARGGLGGAILMMGRSVVRDMILRVHRSFEADGPARRAGAKAGDAREELTDPGTITGVRSLRAELVYGVLERWVRIEQCQIISCRQRSNQTMHFGSGPLLVRVVRQHRRELANWNFSSLLVTDSDD